MKVPLLDLKAQYESIRPEVEKAIRDVMESQHFILGPHVQNCEQAATTNTDLSGIVERRA